VTLLPPLLFVPLPLLRAPRLSRAGCLLLMAVVLSRLSNCHTISKKNVYSRRIGPASGRRASAPFVPYVLNVRPIRSVRPKRLPLRAVRPECPERPGVLGLHLLRLVPPNTLVPVLTSRRTCHGLIPSEHPPSVSSRSGVSRVDLPDSGSPTA